MRKFDNRIKEIIQAGCRRLNTISKTSGISHTYLTKLVQGNINRPGKDKIASILLSLNYSISEINAVLAGYDYRTLNRYDIPEILKNNQKRKIEGNTLTLYDDIHAKLLLSPMEQLGGTKILVKKAPTVLFMPDTLYMKKEEWPEEKDPESNQFYREFTMALFRERTDIFRQSCRKGELFETFICKNCLSEYLDKNLSPENKKISDAHRQLVVQYFANALNAAKNNPDQHRTWVMDRCLWFDYLIQGADRENPKLFFFGRKHHEYEKTDDQMDLQGFTSDAQEMVAVFNKETELCRKAVDKKFKNNYPNSLIAYFLDTFKAFNLAKALDAALV